MHQPPKHRPVSHRYAALSLDIFLQLGESQTQLVTKTCTAFERPRYGSIYTDGQSAASRDHARALRGFHELHFAKNPRDQLPEIRFNRGISETFSRLPPPVFAEKLKLVFMAFECDGYSNFDREKLVANNKSELKATSDDYFIRAQSELLSTLPRKF